MKINKIKFFNKIIITNLLFLASACTQDPVHVEYKNGTFSSKHKKIRPDTKIVIDELPPLELPSTDKSYVIVKEGETIQIIAMDYNVAKEDIIKLNNLTRPYSLTPGQRINLPSYQIHIVEGSETIYDIAEKYKVRPENIIELNTLIYPYDLKSNDKIRIPLHRENPEEIIITSLPNETIIPEVTIGNEIKENKLTVPDLPNSSPKELEFKNEKKIVDIVANPNSEFIWPTQGKIISKFGSPKASGGKNDGIDISATLGSPVKSSRAGTIAYAGDELEGYGNLVIIKHPDNWITAYGNLQEIAVKKGQKVTIGQLVGKIGQSGGVKSPRLHLEMRKGKTRVDPLKFLPKKAD